MRLGWLTGWLHIRCTLVELSQIVIVWCQGSYRSSRLLRRPHQRDLTNRYFWNHSGISIVYSEFSVATLFIHSVLQSCCHDPTERKRCPVSERGPSPFRRSMEPGADGKTPAFTTLLDSLRSPLSSEHLSVSVIFSQFSVPLWQEKNLCAASGVRRPILGNW